MNHNCNRKGIFEVNMAFMREASWEDLHTLFDGVVVLDCRSNFAVDRIEYWAISEHFEEVEPGCMAPEYVPKIEDGRVRWLKEGVEPEPEPEPITLNLPDLNQIRLAVDRVLNKYRAMDPIAVKVDSVIHSMDWMPPHLCRCRAMEAYRELRARVAAIHGGLRCVQVHDGWGAGLGQVVAIPVMGVEKVAPQFVWLPAAQWIAEALWDEFGVSGGSGVACEQWSRHILDEYRVQAAQPGYVGNPMGAANRLADDLQDGFKDDRLRNLAGLMASDQITGRAWQ